MTETDRMQEADEALFKAVDEAIDAASEIAGQQLQSLGVSRSPQDYFADAVLRHAFLRLCRADSKTNTGGDPDIAWKILYMGRNVARHWERERGRPSTQRKRKERQEDIDKDASERRQLALAAHNFAMKTAIRVLIDHARASDPKIVDRMDAAIDTRLEGLGSISETDREFVERAKNSLSFLASAPK